MSETRKTTETQQPDFFDRPETIRWILRVFYLLCALLVAGDFLIHRHIYTDIETIPAFYAIYGFVACVVLVILAKLLRVWLMRAEDYYDANESEQTQDSKHRGQQ